MLMEQVYPGREDDVAHFMSILPALKDDRYIRIDGRPVFVLYSPWDHPHVREWIQTWRQLSVEHGLPGLYMIGICDSTLTFRQKPDGTRERVMPNLESSAELFQTVLDMGFDAVNSFGKRRGEMLSAGKYQDLAKTVVRRLGVPVGQRYEYAKTVKGFFAPEDRWENVFPTILPQWDRTPRMASYDGVYVHATPEAFEKHVRQAVDIVSGKEPEHRVIFLKSWNEGGEGNYVEPDTEYGTGFLTAIRKAL